MSELIHAVEKHQNIRWQLLATVSTLALVGSAVALESANAAENDGDRPTVWIELGGQFENIKTGQEAFVPPFFAVQPSFTTITPENVQKPLDDSLGAEAKISFQPEGTDWAFSVGVRYGRWGNGKHEHQGTTPGSVAIGSGHYYFPPSDGKFVDTVTRKTESHLIADFQAGKDVGLGMFGLKGSSTISAGLRFAQFNTGVNATLGLGPSPFHYKYFGTIKVPFREPHTFLGKVETTRNFHGLGPSVSWDASAPFAGNPDTAEFAFDWGVNAALLFGRQKFAIHHQTTGFYYQKYALGGDGQNDIVSQTAGGGPPRSRSVVVPNVGGFGGVSLQFPNAKVSLGYRADFFFGAMDGGIDTQKSENQGFYGPFATISVGL